MPGRPCPPDHLFAHRAGFALLPGVPGPGQGVTVQPDDLAVLLERTRSGEKIFAVIKVPGVVFYVNEGRPR